MTSGGQVHNNSARCLYPKLALASPSTSILGENRMEGAKGGRHCTVSCVDVMLKWWSCHRLEADARIWKQSQGQVTAAANRVRPRDLQPSSR